MLFWLKNKNKKISRWYDQIIDVFSLMQDCQSSK